MDINASGSQSRGICFWPRRPGSPQHHRTLNNMPSNTGAPWLSAAAAATLAALLLCARAAPLGHAPTVSPSDVFSGEERTEEPSEMEEMFEMLIGSIKHYEDNFADEFHNVATYNDLDDYKLPQLPKTCPSSNFSKEACLKRVVEGLQTYTVLLRFVEKQYPNNRIVNGTDKVREHLVQMMKNPSRVTALTTTQEEQLLDDTKKYDDAYKGKMAAHSILMELCNYLIHVKRVIVNKNTVRAAKRPTALAQLYYQVLNRT